jgi:type II secretory ATPase GspE/PulE/Tfp pilus assembly ATPase PilB-like protein
MLDHRPRDADGQLPAHRSRHERRELRPDRTDRLVVETDPERGRRGDRPGATQPHRPVRAGLHPHIEPDGRVLHGDVLRQLPEQRRRGLPVSEALPVRQHQPSVRVDRAFTSPARRWAEPERHVELGIDAGTVELTKRRPVDPHRDGELSTPCTIEGDVGPDIDAAPGQHEPDERDHQEPGRSARADGHPQLLHRTVAGGYRGRRVGSRIEEDPLRSPAPPPPDAALLDAVPSVLARRALALPTRVDGGVLRVRTLRAGDDEPVLDEMRARVGAYDVMAELDADVERHLLVAYARHALPDVLSDPVTLLDTLLDLAVGSDASDVHLVATPGGLRVRQRIDGDLHAVVDVPAATADALVARIKVRSGLDVAERRLPQDGRLSHELPSGTLDVRVATMPIRSGERITLRLLPDGPTGSTLRALGLPPATVAALERSITASDGLIVVCGPTGSGKTTTLHALLARLAAGPRNVVTLEDPVERIVEGTSQTQVVAAHGLTFATGLRHLLRHDPDILLVGEVRDRETAQLAVEAAHTGHLVLTSLHAVDAPAALTRLHEFGVATTLLADTVRIVVAQRLLALPCPDCSGPAEPEHEAACAACGGAGTRGRSAVAETLELDAALRELLRDGQPPGAHHAELATATVPRLRTTALARAAAGLARTSDALHATPEPDDGRHRAGSPSLPSNAEATGVR